MSLLGQLLGHFGVSLRRELSDAELLEEAGDWTRPTATLGQQGARSELQRRARLATQRQTHSAEQQTRAAVSNTAAPQQQRARRQVTRETQSAKRHAAQTVQAETDTLACQARAQAEAEARERFQQRQHRQQLDAEAQRLAWERATPEQRSQAEAFNSATAWASQTHDQAVARLSRPRKTPDVRYRYLGRERRAYQDTWTGDMLSERQYQKRTHPA